MWLNGKIWTKQSAHNQLAVELLHLGVQIHTNLCIITDEFPQSDLVPGRNCRFQNFRDLATRCVCNLCKAAASFILTVCNCHWSFTGIHHRAFRPTELMVLLIFKFLCVRENFLPLRRKAFENSNKFLRPDSKNPSGMDLLCRHSYF